MNPDDRADLADPCHLWVLGNLEGRWLPGFLVLRPLEPLLEEYQASRVNRGILSHLSVQGILDHLGIRLFQVLHPLLSLQENLVLQDDLAVQGNPSVLGSLSHPSFLVLLGFPL